MNTFNLCDRILAMLSFAVIGFVIGYGFEHPVPIGHFWWLAISWAITLAFRLTFGLSGRMMPDGTLDTRMKKMENTVFTVSFIIIVWTIVQSYIK